MKGTKANSVYVPGGQPTSTYVDRDQEGLEGIIREYLKDPHELLCLAGPTKSGKTVAVRSLIPPSKGIWINAGEISSSQEFWENVAQQIGAFTSSGIVSTTTETKGGKSSVQATLGSKGISVGASKETQSQSADATALSKSLNVSPKTASLGVLKNRKTPLIIDDFHYLDSTTQTELTRSLKAAIFEGTPVIFISVPHRAFDAVKAEPEMNGRVDVEQVKKWAEEELEKIIKQGFDPLNIWMPDGTIKKFVEASYGSPFLVQDFCLKNCELNGATEWQAERNLLKEPDSYEQFFRKVASGVAKTAYDRLAQGPRQRSDRMQRKLKTGDTCDIYKAVLLAIAQTGPKLSLKYEEIRSALRDLLEDQIPQANEVTRVLEELSKIAKELAGEPVLEWNKSDQLLYVIDPFFAFFLRWGIKDA